MGIKCPTLLFSHPDLQLSEQCRRMKIKVQRVTWLLSFFFLLLWIKAMGKKFDSSLRFVWKSRWVCKGQYKETDFLRMNFVLPKLDASCKSKCWIKSSRDNVHASFIGECFTLNTVTWNKSHLSSISKKYRNKKEYHKFSPPSLPNNRHTT